MAKVSKTFEFTHTIKKSRVSNLQIKQQLLDVNVLAEVSYDGGSKHDADSYRVEDIHAVIFDGKNVLELLYMLDALDEIETEAIAEAMELFTTQSAA